MNHHLVRVSQVTIYTSHWRTMISVQSTIGAASGALFVLLLFSSSSFGFGPKGMPVWYRATTTVTVTALEDLIPNRVVLSKDELEANASLTPDGALRYVPGFSLFRRAGSRTANPTTQGVALRGIGASGASRALVLLDGIPINDPFGGWVYWNRVPFHSLQAIEVSRGGTSDIFGADALSGTIHFRRADVSLRQVSLDAMGGTQQTSLASVSFHQELASDLFLGAAGQYFHSNGDFLVEEQNRGAIDSRAGSEHVSSEVHLQKNMDGGRIFVTNSYYTESRGNGTQIQTNDTELWQVSAGGQWYDVSQGEMSFHIYGGGQRYDQTFSAVAPDRQLEFLTREQQVPSQHLGAMFFWGKQFVESHSVYSGVTFREVRGESQERITSTGSLVFQGGEERLAGMFIQDRITIAERFTLTLGSRLDRWQKLDGQSRTVEQTGRSDVETFADTTEWQWSPRLLFQWQLNGSLQWTSSAYKSFRPPTLNELYRDFRVGNVLTIANARLVPEKLVGIETGVRYKQGNFAFNANLFWNQVQDPITNLTLETSPVLILRQRSNVGDTTTTGIEIETQVSRWFGEIEIAYQLAHSTFGQAAEQAIEGNFLPQVPLHSASITYRTTLPSDTELQVRARGTTRSYDDDRNELVLPGYWLADLFVSKRLTPRFELLFAVENLFNTRIVISKTPVDTIGTSTLLTAGLRFRL